MSNTWKDPKIIVGNTATGAYYFPRPHIEAMIWDETRKGNHVLIAAPRRVGKSSVMLAMLENCPEGTQCIFKNIQGVQSETEYYQTLFELIFECLSKFGKGKKWLSGFFKHLNIEEITLEGIKFGEKKPVNYLEEINRILPELAKNDAKIVLLLDELPEVLHNLYKKGKTEEAGSILDRLREWRQNPAIRQHFCFVLAGSVGIHHIVKTIEGRDVDINDFGTVAFEALTRQEAENYLTWATGESTVRYDAELSNHLLSKINYFIPYFINLMLDEMNKTARKNGNPIISTQNIDEAFDRVVKNSDHFKDWKNRLVNYFSKEDAAFLREVLTFIAHRGHIDIRQLFDLAVKHSKTDIYMELVRGLERDGYITEQDSRFLFVSPFLQAFWKRDNPIYE